MKDRSLVKSFRRTFVMILISGILATRTVLRCAMQ